MNRIPSCKSKKSPFETWTGRKPNLSHIRIVGSRTFVHVPDVKRTKLEPKCLEGVLVVYCENTKAYRIYVPSHQRIIVSHDVIIDETSGYIATIDDETEKCHEIFKDPDPFVQQINDPETEPTVLQDIPGRREDTVMEVNHTNPIQVDMELEDEEKQPKYPKDNHETVQPLDIADTFQSTEQEGPPTEDDPLTEKKSEALRRSTRKPKLTYKMKIWKGISMEDDAALALTESTMETFNQDHEISKPFKPISALTLEPYVPINYKDALSCQESSQWKAAINEEYSSILENGTWTVVPLPEGRKPIKCKWVLDYKPAHKGAEARFKARLVACGYAQLYGIDYLDTYSPVVKHYSIRFVLALSAVLDLDMIQLDIKTAFLNGVLEEEIYMKLPEGFALLGRENDVCKLHKSLYGLKQASRCWHTKFDEFIKAFGFSCSKSDRSVYYNIYTNGEYTIMGIYVDDGLVCSNTPSVLTAILDYLSTHFQVRSFPASIFVGLDITRDRPNRTLYVSQADFIKKILKRYNMADCNPASIPADPSNRPGPLMSPKTDEDRAKMETVPMREAIGSLMYLMAMTRGDIALAVNQAAAFVSNPGPGHWEATKQIFRYLAGSVSYGIRFSDGDDQNQLQPLQGFTDANFAADTVARKSTTGVLFLFYGVPVSWGSRRQRATALSTTDAEFFAASEGAREAVWLKALLLELNVSVGQVPIHCDSRCAISIIEDNENHQRVKHIDVFLRQRTATTWNS